MRSRSPKGVLTASKAMDPTTVRLMRRRSLRIRARAIGSRPHARHPADASSAAPRSSSSSTCPSPEPGDGEVLISVSRAGMNFADTHQRHNDYLAAQQLPLVPGGEVAGVREDTGERVVALSGTGGYAEYATAPEALTFPIPDGVDDGTALALLHPGPDRVAPVPHLGARRPGRVGRGRRRRRRRRARSPSSSGKPMGAGRVIATGLDAGQARPGARARRRRGDRRRPRGPEGAPRRGQRRAQGRRRLRDGGRRGLRRLASPRWRRSAGWSTYGIASGEGNEVHTRKLMGRSRAVVGFWLMHCLGRPEMVDEALADLYARAARGELRAVVGATYPLVRGRARPRSTSPSAAPRARSCSTPAANTPAPRKLHRT